VGQGAHDKVLSAAQAELDDLFGSKRPGPTISAPASAVPTNPTSKDLLVVDLAAAKRNKGAKGGQMEQKEDCVQTEVKEDLWAVGSLADTIKGGAIKCESTDAGFVAQGAHESLSAAHAELDDLFGGAGGSQAGVAGQKPKGALLAAHAELDDLFGSAGGGAPQ